MFLLFLCRYEIWFSFLPLTTLRLVQILSVGYILRISYGKPLAIKKSLLGIFGFILFFAVYAALVTLQSKLDFAMLRFVSNFLLFLCASFWILKILTRLDGQISIGRLLDIWLYTSIVQMVISFLSFIDHSFYENLFAIQHLSEGMISREDLIGVRIIGLGNAFFRAGFNYGIDLLLLVTLPYVEGSKIYKNKLFYWCTFIGVLIIGILSARTFWIACFCALVIFFYHNRFHFLNFIGKLVLFLFGIVIVFSLSINILKKYVDNLDAVLAWAFEMFDNYFSTGSIATSSSDKMFDMYYFPTEWSTWIFGDGLMNNPDGSYYMYTDIGFIRLIFFWGVIVTFIFYLYRWFIVKVICSNSSSKALNVCVIIYLLFEYICNLKGLVCGDMFLAWILVYTLYFESKSSCLNEKNSSLRVV